MTPRSPVGFVAFLLTWLFCASSYGQSLIVMYHERPPYISYQHGQISGLSADAAAFAFEGIAIEWQQVPSQRQMHRIKQNQQPLAAVGWFKNEQRAGFAQFSEPLYQDKSIQVLTRAGHGAVLRHSTIESLLTDRQLVLLVKSGYSYGDQLDSAIRNLAPRTISTTQENLVMLQMLQAGRVDYLLIAPEEAEFAISEAGLNRQDFLLHSLQDMPVGEQRFLIFSQQVAPEVIEHINQRLRFYHQRVSAL